MEDKGGPVRVKVMGVDYRLKRTEDTEYLRKIAREIDERIKENASRYPVVSSDRLAVLSAMQLLDELLKMSEKVKREQEEIKRRIEELSGIIQSVLKYRE